MATRVRLPAPTASATTSPAMRSALVSTAVVPPVETGVRQPSASAVQQAIKNIGSGSVATVKSPSTAALQQASKAVSAVEHHDTSVYRPAPSDALWHQATSGPANGPPVNSRVEQPAVSYTEPGKIVDPGSPNLPPPMQDTDTPAYEQIPWDVDSTIQVDPAPGTAPPTVMKADSPSTLASASIHTASIFDRILAFFHLTRTSVQGAQMAGEAANLATMSRSDAAASLVRRSRNGDQNAMAILAVMQENAKTGNPTAKIGVRLVKAYIEANPEDESLDAAMAGESDDDTWSHAVIASQGPHLSNSTVETLRNGLIDANDAEQHMAFHLGLAHGERFDHEDPKVVRASMMGKVIHQARKLQGVRMEHTAVSPFNDVTGWELGE